MQHEHEHQYWNHRHEQRAWYDHWHSWACAQYEHWHEQWSQMYAMSMCISMSNAHWAKSENLEMLESLLWASDPPELKMDKLSHPTGALYITLRSTRCTCPHKVYTCPHKVHFLTRSTCPHKTPLSSLILSSALYFCLVKRLPSTTISIQIILNIQII